MSDEELRRGVRALISSGAEGVDDEALSQIGSVVASAQRSREIKPDIDEVRYLEAYSKICESRLNLEIEQHEANAKIVHLNAEFPNISPGIRRSSVPGSSTLNNGDYDDWSSSY